MTGNPRHARAESDPADENRSSELEALRQRCTALEAQIEEQNADLANLQTQVADSNIRLMDALESLSEGFVLLNENLETIIINSSITELFSDAGEDIWTPGFKLIRVFEALGESGYVFCDSDKDLSPIRAFQQIRDDRTTNLSVRKESGEARWLTLTSRPTFDDGIVLTAQDISELKTKQLALRENTALLETMLNSIGQGICAFDELGRLISWNDLFRELLDLPENFFSKGEFRNGQFRSWVEDQVQQARETAESMMMNTDPAPSGSGPLYEQLNLRLGETHLEISQFAMQEGGNVTTVTDVTERKKAELLLIRRATIDALTGLPNRAAGLERLDMAVAHAERGNHHAAVLYVDLDGFKQVNDTYGHEIGDDLIKEASCRMQSCLRRTDMVARLGGDEFLVVLPEVSETEMCAKVAGKVVDELRRPFPLAGNQITVSCSVGITTYPEDGKTAADLLRNADVAMYTSKASGKNTFRHFSADMNAGLQRRLDLERAFRGALEKGDELFLVFQPIVETSTHRPVGAEALIRWNKPNEGLVRPDEFIPIIEQTNLIVPTGAWVIRQACLEAVAWMKTFGRDFIISVNVSPRQFRSHDLVPIVREALEISTLPPHCLRLEVTESVLAKGQAEIRKSMEILSELGVGISMDDFGTGYSSLSYLKEFPFRTIKIDKSFVQGVMDNEADRELTRTIVSMAHNLRMGVVAEGVETVSQLDFLKGIDCGLVQGYYFGRPEPSNDFVERLKKLLG